MSSFHKILCNVISDLDRFVILTLKDFQSAKKLSWYHFLIQIKYHILVFVLKFGQTSQYSLDVVVLVTVSFDYTHSNFLSQLLRICDIWNTMSYIQWQFHIRSKINLHSNKTLSPAFSDVGSLLLVF